MTRLKFQSAIDAEFTKYLDTLSELSAQDQIKFTRYMLSFIAGRAESRNEVADAFIAAYHRAKIESI